MTCVRQSWVLILHNLLNQQCPNPSIQPGRMWVWNCSCVFVEISQQFKMVTVQVGNRKEILEQHLIQQPLFRGLKTHWLERSLIDPNLQPQRGDKNKCAFFRSSIEFKAYAFSSSIGLVHISLNISSNIAAKLPGNSLQGMFLTIHLHKLIPIKT